MLKIYYHRDFDGMASAAILAEALEETRGEDQMDWSGVNFDRTLDWETFGIGERFALVDFHFHPRADYWFDHHPTTFLKAEHEAAYRPSATRRFDPEAKSCPPIIVRHAREEWSWDPPRHFEELVHWSNIVDAAEFDSPDQALFGTEPALRIMRALTCAPNFDFHDRIVGMMREQDLIQVANDEWVDRCYERAARNRDHAIEAFPGTMVERTADIMLADLRSKKIRRERFAGFYLYPELEYLVSLLPTRAGVHITVSSNPWNRPEGGPHLGELLREYGGGGHHGVGGVNPPDDPTAESWARELYERLTAART